MNSKLKLILLIFLCFRLYYFNSQVSVGDEVRVTGQILREPTIYDTAQLVRVNRFRAYIPLYPEIKYGDSLTLEGSVGDKNILDNPKLISIKESNNPLFALRQRLIENYLSFLPYPHNAIVAGTVLGSQQNIGGEFWDNLKRTGTAHIVVASGTNVTYTALFLLSLFLVIFKRKKAVVVSLMGIWVYVTLSGFDPPLVRAAIMGSLAFTSQLFGRVSNSINLLLFSVLIMILINPVWLSDVGFALSFYATAGLMLFESHLYVLLYKVPTIIRKDLSTTLAAQIAVSPILYITFKYFNVLSPIYNILILWTIPPIMILGFVSGVVGLFSFELGKVISLSIFPFTSWFILVVST